MAANAFHSKKRVKSQLTGDAQEIDVVSVWRKIKMVGTLAGVPTISVFFG